MTGAERTRIMDKAVGQTGDVNLQFVYPEIVIATSFDPESGEQIFSPNDRDALLAKSANALDRLASVGMRLSGFTQESADVAGKDSSATATADSSLSQRNDQEGLSQNYSMAVLPIIRFQRKNSLSGKRQSGCGYGSKNKPVRRSETR